MEECLAANTLAPNGFRDIRRWTGSVPNYAINGRNIVYNYGSDIAWGDPVKLDTSGLVILYTKTATTIDGIAYGVKYFDPNNILSGEFHPAWTQPSLATTAKPIVSVMTDPNVILVAQMRGTAITQSSIGLNVDIYTGTSGVPVTGSGMSTCALDATTADTATLPFRIVGIIGLTAGFEGIAISKDYVPTNDNQWIAVTMNTQDMTTRTGHA